MAACTSLLLIFVLPSGSQADFAVRTRDGLQLEVSSTGSVARVTVGGRALRRVPGRGGFAVRRVGGMPNLVPNGSFERDRDHDGVPDGWNIVGVGATPRVVRSVARAGRRSVRIRNDHVGTSRGLAVTFPVRPGVSYTVAAWFRARDVLPPAPPAFSPRRESPVRLKVRQVAAGGRVLQTQDVYGYTNTAPWNRQFGGFRALPATRSVTLVVAMVRGSGTMWADGVYVGRLLDPRQTPIAGAMTRTGGGDVRQTAQLARLGVAFAATYHGDRDHLDVHGAVTATGHRDLPFQLTYTLPIDARGWWWDDYARRSRLIRSGRYAYVTRWDAYGASRYPYDDMHNSHSELVIALPLDQPRIAGIQYVTGHGLSITFDLGVSPAARARAATFRFSIYAADPAWGFRSATAKYYRIYPRAFVRRTVASHEGIWFGRPDRRVGNAHATTPGESRLYGLGLDVLDLGWAAPGLGPLHAPYLHWDNRRGIYAVAYNHHWVAHLPFPSSTFPAYRSEVRGLRTEARDRRALREREEAQAVLYSTARDFNGRLLYEAYRGRLAFYENPDVTRARGADWDRLTQDDQVRQAIAVARAAGATLNGIHMDSTSGVRRFGAAEDYSHAHWRQARMPLTYSPESGDVIELGVFPSYSHLRALAAFLHRRGMILSANFNGSEARAGAWFGADVIDDFGIEGGLDAKAGAADPYVTVDSIAMFKRSLADDRPVSVLDEQIGTPAISLRQVAERLNQALFYDIFAGVSHPISAGRLATRAGRALYARYTPLFRRLAAAGWRPITLARSSDPAVWVERYGAVQTGNLAFTLRDNTHAPERYSLRIEVPAACRGTALTAREAITGTPLAVVGSPASGSVTIAAPIGAAETQVVAVRARPACR